MFFNFLLVGVVVFGAKLFIEIILVFRGDAFVSEFMDSGIVFKVEVAVGAKMTDIGNRDV